MNKKDIIKLLETIATYMELKGDNPFKISAFRKAAAALETDERTLTEIEDFTKLQGIGKGTAAVITDYAWLLERYALLLAQRSTAACAWASLQVRARALPHLLCLSDRS